MRARIGTAFAAAGVILLTLSGCAIEMNTGPETIRNFDIHYTIERDGTVHVVETIEYDFAGAEDRHGIDRFLASRFATDTPGEDRVYGYHNIEVSSPTGASALFSTRLDNALQIRVGNANATVGGAQTYVLSYDIDGALNRAQAPDGSIAEEFYWNATGSYWDPSILRTTVTVDGPAAVGWVACYAGFDGTTDACASASAHGNSATFLADTLSSRQGLTIVAAWPEGTFTDTAPVLEPSLPLGAPPVTSGSNDGPDPFWNPLH